VRRCASLVMAPVLPQLVHCSSLRGGARVAASRLKEQCRERPARWLLGHRRSTHARGELSLLVPCDSELEGRWRHRSSISKRKRPSASPAADRRLLRDEMQQTAGRAHYRRPRGERACHVGLRVPESLPPSEQRNGHPPAVQGYGVAPHDVASRPQRLEHHQLIPELPPAGSGGVADAPIESNVSDVAGFDGVEDWVGEPPEGRYSRDRAKPEFWRGRWRLFGTGLIVVLLVLVIILLSR